MIAIRFCVLGILPGAALALAVALQAAATASEPPPLAKPADAPHQAAANSQPGEDRPLLPVLQEARQMIDSIEKNVQDYSAVLVRSERADDETSDNCMFLKVRHKPFSVYLHFLDPPPQNGKPAPANRKGEEAIYVEGRNDNKILGHTTGMLGQWLGTLSLDPNGPIAMRGQRHPITDIGVLSMTRQIANFAEKNLDASRCQVQCTAGAKINDRVCTCTELVRPVYSTEVRSYLARVFVDDQLHLPLRYELYVWPQKADAEPALLEAYTYLDLRLNNGYTDADFDPRNPNYGFAEGATK